MDSTVMDLSVTKCSQSSGIFANNFQQKNIPMYSNGNSVQTVLTALYFALEQVRASLSWKEKKRPHCRFDP